MEKRKMTSEQAHKFEEERMRRILVHVFPEKYAGAELSESPDIIVPQRSIGIEVTDSMLQKVQEMRSLASAINHGRIDPNSKRYQAHNHSDIMVRTMPNGQPLAGFCVWGETHDLLAAYLKKKEKLNQPHYTVFKENHLLITAWMIDEEDMESGLLKLITHIRNEKTAREKRQFDCVYIFTEKYLLTLRVEDEAVVKIAIPSEVMSEVSEQVFISIMGMSRDSFYSK